MKFLRAASQCLRVCVYARVFVCVCVWTCQFRVELLSKTHTSNKSNVTTGRNGTATHLLLPPLFAVVADDDELSLAQYVLCVCDCVCVCIVQAASLLRSTAANFQGRVLLAPLPLSATASTSFCWHTRTTHTPPQQLCTSLCVRVCEAINLMIYWRLPQNLLLFFCCCRCRCLRCSTLLFCVFLFFCCFWFWFWRSFTRRNFL